MRISAFLFSIVLLTLPFHGHASTKQEETRAFLKADKNGDKQLTKAEFRTFIRLLAAAGNAEAKRAVRYGELGFTIGFSNADANSNGLLTPKELERLRK
ncbi:MAG: EF-hand domain-containing protein [Pseudomonadota bacterium]